MFVQIKNVCLYKSKNVCFTCFKLNEGYSSASYIRHQQMPFLRRVNVSKTILKLRNLGVLPFRTDPDSMPEGMQQVDNFTQFIILFYVIYCKFEGLARSSDLARKNLIYLLNGECETRQSKRGPKRSTIIFEVPFVVTIRTRIRLKIIQTPVSKTYHTHVLKSQTPVFKTYHTHVLKSYKHPFSKRITHTF